MILFLPRDNVNQYHRIRWYGYVVRMTEGKLPKKVLNIK
jgi:hypothetical protein